jgi:hypothetical protein
MIGSSRSMLRSGRYFWLTGVLSSFLDNAPTYLVFFNLAGGDAPTLMGALASTLAANSCGAVFMGANTYIGNATQFHGQGRGRGVGHPHAELPRLHGLVVRYPVAAVRSDHADVLLLNNRRA